MACGGHCNVCPAHPGYDPPVSAVTWRSLYPTYCLGHTLDTNDYVEEDYHYYYLAYYINQEIARRAASKPSGWDAWYAEAPGKTSSSIVYASDYLMFKKGLDACGSWSPTYATDAHFVAGQNILHQSTTEMRNRVNTLRAVCLCNCNYSCTCNCNYCTCNCNYACTCNCNYSDKRLKTDIKYL